MKKLTSGRITQCCGWAITWFTMRKTKVSCLATIAPSTNNIWTTWTLPTKLLTFKAFRSMKITLAWQSPTIVLHC